MKKALEMNKEGWKPDGIEEIKEDGTVVFTDLTCRLLKELLDLNWTQVKVTEMEQMTEDLIRAYTKLPK